MAVDIGPKIGMSGENEFRQSIKSINDQIKTLGTEMAATTSAFDANDRSMKNLTAQAKILNSEIDLQKDKLGKLQSGLEESIKLYGENDSRTLKWKQAVNNAQTELNKMEGQLKTTNAEMRSEVLEKAKKGWEVLGTTVAATATALASAATAAAAAVSAAGKAMVGFSKDGAAYADTVLTDSQVTGIATDKLQEYQYAAELIDVSVDTLTGSMTKNLQSMMKVADGNADMTEAYDALGVSVLDADGNMRDSETVYWELIDALGDIDDETQRDAMAMSVLGKSAKELNPLITAGADRMAELGQEARDAGYVLSDDALGAFGAFDDELRKLESGATAAKNALGTVLLPVLTDLAGDGVDLLGQFTSGILDANGDISKMGEVIDEVLPQVLDSIMDYLPQLLDLVMSIMTTVGNTILKPENLNKIVDSVAEMMRTLIEWILKSLPQIIEAAVRLVTTLANSLLTPENIELLINATIQIVVTLAQAIIENLPVIVSAVVQLVTTFAETIGEHLSVVMEKGRELIDTIKTAVKEKIEDAKNWGKDLIQNFIDGITAKWQALKDKIKGVADTVKNFLGFSEPKEGPLSNFHTFAPDMMDLFIKGIADGTSRLQEQIGKSFNFGSQITGGIADVRGGSTVYLDASGFENAVNRINGGQNVNIEFTGSLAQLGRVLQPVIKNESKRLGTVLVGV